MLTGRRDRAFLAEMLTHAGRVVSVDHLAEAAWPAQVPVNRANAVHVRVSRIRSLFRSMSDPGTVMAVMSTEPGAYRLCPDEVDADQFEKLLAAGMRERDKGFLDKAADLLERALSLWEGEAFTDVTAGDCVAAEADRLTELRLVALEQHTDVMLAMGAHTQVVSRLKPLVARYPLRETFHGHLMTALHRSSRSAEALAVYAELRSKLADELGAEPTSELRDLHRSLLERDAQDSGTANAWTSTNVSRSGWVSPSQLPADTPDFVPGEVSKAVAHVFTARDPTTTTVAAITGQGGAGKTTVAVHLAQQLRSSFPDGQLYVDLGGSAEHPAEPEAVLAQMLSAMNLPLSELSEGLTAKAACFRDGLKWRVLLVLDDAADEAQLQHLLPGNPESGVIITSSARLTGMPFTSRIELNDMSQHQAVTLLKHVVGAARVDQELAAAREVARLCCYLPFALRIAGARLAAKSHWTFGDLASRLSHQRWLLDELTRDSLSVRSCFAPAYRRLTEDERRLFRMIGLSGVGVSSAFSATAVLDLPVPDHAEALERLVDSRLLKVVDRGPLMFRMLGLAAAFAREVAEADASDTEREAAQRLPRLQDQQAVFCLSTSWVH